jgi:hypothetical protein
MQNGGNIMINREKLKAQYLKEIELFEKTHPKSKELYERAKGSLLQGVPMNWMVKWAGSYPVCVASAKGAISRMWTETTISTSVSAIQAPWWDMRRNRQLKPLRNM